MHKSSSIRPIILCNLPLDISGPYIAEPDGYADAAEGTILTDATGQLIANTLGEDGYGVLHHGSARARSADILAQIKKERHIFGGINRVTLGFIYESSHTDFATSTGLGMLTDVRRVTGLAAMIVQGDAAIAPVKLIAKTRYLGIFIAENLPVTDTLQAELAMRNNYARIRLEDQIGTALNGDYRFRRLNPSVELNWRITDAIDLSAGCAETNRTPTPA